MRKSALVLTPLTACLALALNDASAADRSGVERPLPRFTMNAHQTRLLQKASPRHVVARGSVPSGVTTPVTNCLDDNSAGSLRAVITAAADTDTIDMSALTCSAITLSQGALVVTQNGLTLLGPTPAAPATGPGLIIDADYTGRVISATGTSGTLSINNLALVNGSVHRPDQVAGGGCIQSGISLSLTNSAVSNCAVSGRYAFGGAINALADVTLTNSQVTGSRAIASTTSAGPSTGNGSKLGAIGGGIYSYGTATIVNSTISGNEAMPGTNGSGGQYGYFSGGGLTIGYFAGYYGKPQTSLINGSTISGNTMFSFGGGVTGNGKLTVSNSTISGNRSGGAGAINGYRAGLYLQNSTIAFNTAYNTGGVYAPGANFGPFSSDSTIMASNVALTPVHAADLASYESLSALGDNNLIVSSDSTVTFTNPQLSADPKLLPLADNGGPTRTHALPGDSPAIATGNNVAGLATDQRGPGFPRSIGGATDIGAFERGDGIFADGFEGP